MASRTGWILTLFFYLFIGVIIAPQTNAQSGVEPITGLPRTVMYAGIPAVISSLWVVDDPATKKLMLHFYENLLGKNISKTDALRQAKLAMIADKRYVSPFCWSAFVMYGE